MTAPKEVLDLVERFDRGLDAYRSPAYNETQLRREFLDPFFVALGWDVENRAGWAEREIRLYVTRNGKVPYSQWGNSLQEKRR